MNDSVVSKYFGQSHAAAYDDRWKKTAPISELLHFLMRMILLGLPANARILCVGAGTGSEIISLAHHFPGWRFTAVEPSGPMLEVCRRKAEEAGITARCEFHEGYLNALPPTAPFDAATSILVSQFLTVQNERQEFFRQIAKRLRPGSYLVSADLASSAQPAAYDSLIDIWLRTHSGAIPPESAKASCSNWGKEVAVSSPHEIESILVSSGFENPILFYQALFIHAWYARTPL